MLDHFRRRHGGGGKKRGVENLTNDTPLKGGFGPPLVRYVFHPPQVSVLYFSLYENPRQSRPEALLKVSESFRESAFSGTFSSPHTFCTPPYHDPITNNQNPQAVANCLRKSPQGVFLTRLGSGSDIPLGCYILRHPARPLSDSPPQALPTPATVARCGGEPPKPGHGGELPSAG